MSLFNPLASGMCCFSSFFLSFFLSFFILLLRTPSPRSSQTPLTFSYSRANHHQPNITIPYASILASAITQYHSCENEYLFWGNGNPSINTAKSTTPSSSITSGSGKRPLSTLPRSGPMSNGGQQSSLSTLAGRLVANGLFSHGGKRQPLSTFAQPPSILASGHAVKGPAAPDGRQYALGTARFGGRPPLATSPAKAVITPWSRLLARLPRKW